MIIAPGTTSQSIDVQIVDDSGAPVTGLVAAAFPSVYYSIAGPNAAVQITPLSDLALITTVFTAKGVKERTGTAGFYRLDVPDAAFAAAGILTLYGEATGKHLIVPGGAITVASSFTATDRTTLGSANTSAGASATSAASVDGKLTPTRAGYLDNLSAGAVATATALTAVSTQVTNLNNLSAQANLFAPPVMEIPDSVTNVYQFILTIADSEGHLIDLDSNAVTLTATNAVGVDRSANLSSVAHAATGRYTFTYSVTSAAAKEAIMFTASGAVGASARFAPAIVAVADYDETLAILAIKAKTDQLGFTNAGKVDATAVIVSDKTGYALTSGERDAIADAQLDRANGIEPGITPRQSQKVVLAASGGKLSGANTSSVAIRNPGDTKDRIVAAVDASGNRSSVTLDLT